MIENKEIMARNILKFMELKNVKATDICKQLGFKQNTFSDWVNAKTYPRIDAIEKLANYFQISKADLVEESGTPYYLNDDARELAEFLFNNPDYKVLFDASRKVKREDIQFIKEMMDRFNGGN